MVDLLSIADRLSEQYVRFRNDHSESLHRLMNSARELQDSWSGSNIGYHAHVYYEGLVSRPSKAQFSPEWGFMCMTYTSLGSIGEWREYNPEVVKNEIRSRAGEPELSVARRDSVALSQNVEECRSEIISSLILAIEEQSDDFLMGLKEEAEKVSVLDKTYLGHSMLRDVVLMSTDSNAVMHGAQLAPHQEILADVLALNSAPSAADALATIARRAGSHLQRRQKGQQDQT